MSRFLFINENIAGHRTVNHNLRKVFAGVSGVDIDYMDIPPAAGLRRIGSARIPGLARYDADLQPLRAQLLAANWVRRQLAAKSGDRAGQGDRASHYDALHFYTHNAALLSTAAMVRIPSVISSDSTNVLNSTRIHGRAPSAFTPKAAAMGRWFELRAYDRAYRLTPSSQWAARNLESDYGIDPARIEVNPMGILVPEIARRTDHPTRDGSRLRIGFVGNPFDRKGGQWLLDLHASLWRDRADLVLVTTSDVPRTPGVEVIDDLRPGDGRLWEILGSCDVFTFPSAIDQAPNAVLEAMAAWLPVVAIAVSAVPEMVVDGRTGFVVPKGDKTAYGQRVSQLLDSQSLRLQMGSEARALVSSKFNMERTARRLLEILAEAAASLGGAGAGRRTGGKPAQPQASGKDLGGQESA